MPGVEILISLGETLPYATHLIHENNTELNTSHLQYRIYYT